MSDMHNLQPQDAERLEWLELQASNSGHELESAIELADRATENVERWRRAHKINVRLRDEFKAALKGMKDGKYAV